MIIALLSLRRSRKAAAATTSAARKSVSMVEMGKPSSEYSELGVSSYSEMGPSSIGEETLPSRPRSTAPSRQLSMANHSTRPPTYYSSGDDSLLVVDEKDEFERAEKGRSVGYA